MKAISRLLLACAAVVIAASQADTPPPAYAHGPWRYRRDWAPRYYAPPQYHNDLGAAIAGALAGAALQLIPRATEALAARLPPPPGAPPPPPVAAPPLAPNAGPPPAPDMAPPPVAAVPPPAAPPAVPPQAELSPGGDPLDAIPDNSSNAHRITRAEVEAALTDWCASHGDAPLCRKMQAQ
jgi:hypothetical protein